MPFGSKKAYAKEVMKASLERISHLIKVCGFLIQTKVYLFGRKDHKKLENRKSGFAGNVSIFQGILKYLLKSLNLRLCFG